MSSLKRVIAFVVIGAVLVLATAPSAHAYIDPQSGSYVMQILIAGLAAGGLAIATFWRRIFGFVGRIFGKGKELDGAGAGAGSTASTPIVPAVEVSEPPQATQVPGDEGTAPEANEAPEQPA